MIDQFIERPESEVRRLHDASVDKRVLTGTAQHEVFLACMPGINAVAATLLLNEVRAPRRRTRPEQWHTRRAGEARGCAGPRGRCRQ